MSLRNRNNRNDTC